MGDGRESTTRDRASRAPQRGDRRTTGSPASCPQPGSAADPRRDIRPGSSGTLGNPLNKLISHIKNCACKSIAIDVHGREFQGSACCADGAPAKASLPGRRCARPKPTQDRVKRYCRILRDAMDPLRRSCPSTPASLFRRPYPSRRTAKGGKSTLTLSVIFNSCQWLQERRSAIA